jgi:predicted nucleic acid-binding protein
LRSSTIICDLDDDLVNEVAQALGLTLLHHDRDFGVIARVTGQPMRWYGPG